MVSCQFRKVVLCFGFISSFSFLLVIQYVLRFLFAQKQSLSFDAISHKERLSKLLSDLKDEYVLYQDEIPPSFMKTTITTPYDGEVPDRHALVDEKCPRYVTMTMNGGNGIGHQMGTHTTALITSIFMGLTFVSAPFVDKGKHGVYPGIGNFTGLAEGELTLDEVLAKVDKVIDVIEMPVKPSSDNLLVLYEPLRLVIREKYKDECNVLFRLREYFSYDYGTYTKAIVSSKFRNAPYRHHISILYDRREFIVALHVRIGDINPTSEAYFLAVLAQMLPVLSGISYYRVHIFAEGSGAEDHPDIVNLVGKERIAFHPVLPPFESFYHLTQAHVFVMSASGFSQFAAVAGTRALVFSPPSRERFPLKFCPPYAVCCNSDGRFEPDGYLRLRWRLVRWLKTQRLENVIDDLRLILKSLD